VEFGDHSHEPVPFAIAHVRHVVQTLGGDAAVQAIPLGPIPHPEDQQQGGGSSGSQAGGAAFQQQGAAAAAGGSVGGSQNLQQDGRQQQAVVQQQSAQQPSEQQQQQQQLRPQRLEPLGDRVATFDEISVAAGALGRFPGSQVMPLIRQFIGLEPAV
jgi:hypothetical protein